MSSFTKYARVKSIKSATDFYRRRQRRKHLRDLASQGALLSGEQIFDSENLIDVFRQLKQQAGTAPGIDGVTYSDLSAPEMGTMCRTYATVIENGLYHPAPSRLVQIPKASGKGSRTLALRTIMDRVVAAALNNALAPF
jgi:hypothetical protein